jgi:hypothetical protein
VYSNLVEIPATGLLNMQFNTPQYSGNFNIIVYTFLKDRKTPAVSISEFAVE